MSGPLGTPETRLTCNTNTWPLEGSTDPEIAWDRDEGKTAMKKVTTKKKKEDGDGRCASRMTNSNNATSFEGANVT